MNIFDRYYQKYDSWYEKNRFAYLSELAVLKKSIPKNKRGLEIGVGTGRFAAPLNISEGIDPSPQMLEIAKQRGVSVRLGTGEDIPFAENEFDYAALIMTLCFVSNPLKVLKETGRVLKTGGRLIIGIVDKESFLGKFYESKKSIFYKNAHFFSIPELTMMLKKVGFGRFVYYQTLFSFPEEMTAVERPLKGFGKGGFVVVKSVKE